MFAGSFLGGDAARVASWIRKRQAGGITREGDEDQSSVKRSLAVATLAVAVSVEPEGLER
jgi:hypothetical protein